MSLLEVLMLYPETFTYDDYTLEEPVTVSVGEQKRIDRLKIAEKYRGKKSGYVYSMGIQLNSKNAIIKILYKYAKREHYAIGAPSSLVESGLVQPNPTGLWVARYDDTNDYYAVFYTPFRGLPFWDEIEVWIIPYDEDVTIKWYSRLFLIFDLDRVTEVIREWMRLVRALEVR